jgi:hypothetical protein
MLPELDDHTLATLVKYCFFWPESYSDYLFEEGD